jgi:haloalkane dehalogenase
MTILQTPADRFLNLPDYDFAPHYVSVGDAAQPLQMHYIDEGDPTAPVVLLLHGEPSWSYLYRKMIPVFVEAGYRAIAPDLVGFGKSDKILEKEVYSYHQHVSWLTQFVETLDLQDITLVAQDWGGLLGLRVLAENQSRFARVSIANTGLPTGDQTPSEAFLQWQTFSQTVPEFPTRKLTDAGVAAYDAPFPDESYKAAARMFPALVPTAPDDPATEANRRAWAVLMQWQKPFLTCFSDQDPVSRGADAVFQKLVPGAKNQPHQTLVGGGHFLQEDVGQQWAQATVAFIQNDSATLI